MLPQLRHATARVTSQVQGETYFNSLEPFYCGTPESRVNAYLGTVGLGIAMAWDLRTIRDSISESPTVS